MHTINIYGKTPMESILSSAEDVITKYQANYILLSFQYDVDHTDRKKTVETIKKYFDIFLLLKSDIPNDKQRIEEYFSYGVHGIYFDISVNIYTREQAEIMSFAVELFTRGWIFASSRNDETMIEELLSLKIVPIISRHDDRLIEFIKTHEDFNKLSPGLLKSIPLFDQSQSEYSLTDKIKMKMLLETLNLRQKLMIKSVDESLSSSGL
ncbi:hypothetical protein [Geosporobacter ferrireducens]|uniref:GP-PDE domain-containing protein n=2 Tax=Geosporobacter ferrireducens TaxID=1424294 RepID=A0A1D8GE43_9FIRM|nr:hypothetical protein [Geosporobacter ferrireducens]AOT69175.1 hypothetical protein Gferi_06115 [Geosporobacter ferrireducens]